MQFIEISAAEDDVVLEYKLVDGDDRFNESLLSSLVNNSNSFTTRFWIINGFLELTAGVVRLKTNEAHLKSYKKTFYTF